ncbi:50S ribosomal protein L11 methyltransferase, partial [Staphylococcus ureilyticus]|nr:50S ribosomal protein L11 methyltransferase [Staphylococcus ureilyticus]
MNWTEISITANHDTIPIISNILEEFRSNGVVIEDSLDLQNGFADKFGEIYEL